MAYKEGIVRGTGLDIGEEKRGMPDWENYLRKGRVKESRTADL